MNPSETVETTLLGAIILRTLGAIDPESGSSYMPAPSSFVAIFATWTVLGFLADTRWARTARAMSIVLLLSMLVLGGAGQLLINFMGTISSRFGGSFGATNPAGENTPAVPTATAPRTRAATPTASPTRNRLPFTGANTPRGTS